MSDNDKTPSPSASHPSITTIFSPMADSEPLSSTIISQDQGLSLTSHPDHDSTTLPSVTSTILPPEPVGELWFYINGIGRPTTSPTGFLIGRGEVCDIRINDQQVSTRHCQIKGGILIDCRSTNGTSVNGEVLVPNKPHQLANGDLVYIGSTEIAIRPQDSADGGIKPLDITDLPAPTTDSTNSPSHNTSTSAPSQAFLSPSVPSDSLNRFKSRGLPGKTPLMGKMGRGAFDPAALAAAQQEFTTSSSPPPSSSSTLNPISPTPSIPESSSTSVAPLAVTGDISGNDGAEKGAEKTPSEPTFAQSLLNLPPVTRLGGVNLPSSNATSNTLPGTAGTMGGSSTATGIPNTDDILNSERSVQRAHIEFLRGEIFRMRRAQVLDKKAGERKKPGLIGGFTSGGDNSDIFKEVIDLKKQMADMKFVMFYGEDQETISNAMSTNDPMSLLSADRNNNNNNNHNNDNNEELLQKSNEHQEMIKQLEFRLSQLSLEITTLQGEHDLELTKTQDKYQSLIADKDVELRHVTAAFEKDLITRGQEYQEKMDILTKNLAQQSIEYQEKIAKVQKLVEVTNDDNTAHIQQYDALQDKYTTLQDQLTLLKSNYMIMEGQKLELEASLRNQKVDNQQNEGQDGAIVELKQQYDEQITTLRQQLEEKQLKVDELLKDLKEVKDNANNNNNNNNNNDGEVKEENELITNLQNENEKLRKELMMMQEEISKNAQQEKNNNQMKATEANIDLNTVTSIATTSTIGNIASNNNQDEKDFIVKQCEEKITVLKKENDQKVESLMKENDQKVQVLQRENDKMVNLVKQNEQLSTQLSTSQTQSTSQLDKIALLEKEIALLKNSGLSKDTNDDAKVNTTENKNDNNDKISNFSPSTTKGQLLSVDPLVDPVAAIKELPPQLVALIAGPAIVLGTILALLMR